MIIKMPKENVRLKSEKFNRGTSSETQRAGGTSEGESH